MGILFIPQIFIVRVSVVFDLEETETLPGVEWRTSLEELFRTAVGSGVNMNAPGEANPANKEHAKRWRKHIFWECLGSLMLFFLLF